MKIRIKGNTIRYRLTRSETDYFAKMKAIEEKTDFGTSSFIYALISSKESTTVSADYYEGKITVRIPENISEEWTSTNKVGVDGEMEIGNGKNLYILVEKDFKCLDTTNEDQSDNYENPLAAIHGK
jgi:hypothetical protein